MLDSLLVLQTLAIMGDEHDCLVVLSAELLGHYLGGFEINWLYTDSGIHIVLNFFHQGSLSYLLLTHLSVFVKVVENWIYVVTPFVFINLLLNQLYRFLGNPWTKLIRPISIWVFQDTSAESLLGMPAQLMRVLSLIGLSYLDTDAVARTVARTTTHAVRTLTACTIPSYNSTSDLFILLIHEPQLIMIKLFTCPSLLEGFKVANVVLSWLTFWLFNLLPDCFEWLNWLVNPGLKGAVGPYFNWFAVV